MMAASQTSLRVKLDQVVSSMTALSTAIAGGNQSGGALESFQNINSPTRISSPSNPPSPTESVLCITTTVVNEQCSSLCRCTCHCQTQLKTPRVLREIIGHLFYTYSGTPAMGRKPCDFPMCRQTAHGSVRLLYYFPQWAVARAICLTGTWRDLVGPGASWTIRMPRLVPWGPIWSSIEHGDEAKMLRLFSTGSASPFDIHGDDGRSLLHHAIWYKRFNMCYRIAREGADWGHRDVDGSSAADVLWPSLLTGVGYRDPALRQLKQALDQDYDFDNMQFNSLHMIIVGLSKVALKDEIGLNHGHINEPDTHGRTPLMWAAMRSDFAVTKVLLEWKAKVNAKDREGLTPLHYAARQGAYKCAEILIAAGAMVDIDDYAGRTPLIDFCFHSRAQFSQLPLFALLVRSGASIFHKSGRRWWTCLHMAASAGNVDILLALIELGVDIDARNKDGNTPAMMAISENRSEALEILLQNGAKLDFYDKFGRGTLMLAARYGSITMLEALACEQARGLDVHARDADGYTALDYFDRFRAEDRDEENPISEMERQAFLTTLEFAKGTEKVQNEENHILDEKSNPQDELASSLHSDGSFSDDLFHSCLLSYEEERPLEVEDQERAAGDEAYFDALQV